MARSLDDLETAAASDSELRCRDLQGCGSESSLNSNGSLPGAQVRHRLPEGRVASWAVSFERLLQDPVGISYFSEFLKKEFSEENILFWQACELFSQVPEDDKKQLSQKAQEIYNSFLSSKATMPVNIDSQAQLADNVLNAPQPNMFKEPQLQIFNLMKFDSYSRFLKSSLYQECMLAEVEGRPLPDPYQVPCSPAPSKHSFSSDRSTLTPTKKVQIAVLTSHNDLRDDPLGKKKGNFFSWSRNRSFGKGPKKRDIGDFSYNSNGRRESQGSLSSGTSQELTSSSPGGKSECEYRNSVATGEKGDRGPKQCSVSLPDGTNCHLALSHGTSIRQLLLELCRKHSVNLAAVDLFLIGGEKPLVLDQDSMTLCSRELRLEKRTLFRLDLVPINRSVGLKAKPTKPVTEVLRPVVAKYGLRLSDLVARISGETEILDLGLPISNLDGLRVVLERADPSAKGIKTHTFTHGDALYAHANSPKETPRDKKRDPCTPDGSKKKSNKKRADEAEELFELLSRAQSSRVDDQRGLLRKEDLVLPDFLRLDSPPTLTPKPNPDPDHPVCSTPTSHKTGQPKGQSATTPHPTQHSTDTQHSCPTHPANTGTEGVRGDDGVGNDSGDREQLPFCAPVSPILRPMGRALEEETPADLTLVGEGDISSPNSTLLPVPMPPTPPRPSPSAPILPEATYTPPPPCLHPPTTAGILPT
uniref:Uncharacterized protein n=1 Tax=Denticeps clupeoides TaxID=299321 RepID=A0AAY4DJC3_9TELE